MPDEHTAMPMPARLLFDSHLQQAAPSEVQTAGELHFKPEVEVVLQHWDLGSMHLLPHLTLPAVGQPVFEDGWHCS